MHISIARAVAQGKHTWTLAELRDDWRLFEALRAAEEAGLLDGLEINTPRDGPQSYGVPVGVYVAGLTALGRQAIGR